MMKMPDMPINRQYKDRLFKFIFGNPVNREWTLNLYNAVNGTNYTDVDSIELTTIEDAVYMGMKNDVSFLFSDMMNFYEQQSSYLLKNQEEVKTMCITEYNQEEVMDIRFAEGKEEGREEGMLTLAQAAEEAHMSASEFENATKSLV